MQLQQVTNAPEEQLNKDKADVTFQLTRAREQAQVFLMIIEMLKSHLAKSGAVVQPSAPMCNMLVDESGKPIVC